MYLLTEFLEIKSKKLKELNRNIDKSKIKVGDFSASHLMIARIGRKPERSRKCQQPDQPT